MASFCPQTRASASASTHRTASLPEALQGDMRRNDVIAVRTMPEANARPGLHRQPCPRHKILHANGHPHGKRAAQPSQHTVRTAAKRKSSWQSSPLLSSFGRCCRGGVRVCEQCGNSERSVILAQSGYGALRPLQALPCSPLVSLPIKVLLFSAASAAPPSHPRNPPLRALSSFFSSSLSSSLSSFIFPPRTSPSACRIYSHPSALQLVITNCINHKQID